MLGRALWRRSWRRAAPWCVPGHLGRTAGNPRDWRSSGPTSHCGPCHTASGERRRMLECLCACVCVSQSVCESEREWEKDREKEREHPYLAVTDPIAIIIHPHPSVIKSILRYVTQVYSDDLMLYI